MHFHRLAHHLQNLGTDPPLGIRTILSIEIGLTASHSSKGGPSWPLGIIIHTDSSSGSNSFVLLHGTKEPGFTGILLNQLL